MKKLVTGFLAIMLFSCSNGDHVAPTNESAPNTPNVENVNGNMPDTTNSIKLGKPDTTPDSVHLKDSLKK